MILTLSTLNLSARVSLIMPGVIEFTPESSASSLLSQFLWNYPDHLKPIAHLPEFIGSLHSATAITDIDPTQLNNALSSWELIPNCLLYPI